MVPFASIMPYARSGALGTSRSTPIAQQRFGDQHPVNLVGALDDLEEFRVPEMAAYGVLVRRGIGTEDLRRFDRGAHEGVRGEQFGHRRREPGSPLPLILL